MAEFGKGTVFSYFSIICEILKHIKKDKTSRFSFSGRSDGRTLYSGWKSRDVREQLLYRLDELGIGILLLLFQIGSLPHDLTTKSTNLFATKVLPRLRDDIRRKLPHLLKSKATSTLSEAQA